MNRIANLPSTKEFQKIDAAHHVHPFSDMAELNQTGSRVIVKGDGIFLYDNDGAKFLDAMSGLWCVNIGYGRSELAKAAEKQMQKLPFYNTFFGTTHPPVINLSEKISSIAPKHLNHVFFSSSGSEANDTNIRLVRHFWATYGKPTKKIIISRLNAYHGSSLGSASLGGMKSMHSQGGMPIPDIIHIDQPYWYAEGGNMSPNDFGIMRAKELETKIMEIGSDNIAAFIAEPIQGAGGVIIPPETYWPEIQRICEEHNILLIADEVICGFGRTGNWFGSDTFSIKPDLMTIAKGLSSGYQPIGGSIISDRVASVLETKGGEFCHGYTYSGHPVAAAVACENIRILQEENIISSVRDETGPYLKEKWAELSNHPLVGEARSLGMLGAIELSPEPKSRASFKAAEGTAGLITRNICIRNGLIMRHVYDKMIISPPLIITTYEIDNLMSLVWKCLDEAKMVLEEKGLMSVGNRRTQ
ncbi:MAG: aspartate aminotransferase family protein [Paracoccaceae bacterium]|nr:aspartate aminotransferase family protein [Paracoccaceae bacterium]